MLAGSASPQTVRKLMALSEQTKTRPHHSRHGLSSSVGPYGRISNVNIRPPALLASSHERSYSDTTGSHQDFHSSALMSAVDLSAESSSVTSLSNLLLRKNIASSGK